ncbi:hypothetical protein D3C87_910940 [compost metagenome]
MIYASIFIILAIFSVLDLTDFSIIYKSTIFIGLVLFLISLSSMRWEVGPDWESYFSFYQDIEAYTSGNLMKANFMEKGYTLMNIWFSNMGFSYSGFLFVLAVITIGLKARVIFENKEILLISLLLYYSYYLADIASIRQFTAVSITTFSTVFIRRKKPIIFVLLVLLACSLHISCIVFLLAYWLYNIRIDAKILYLMLCGALILGIINIANIAINTMIAVFGNGATIAIKLLNYQEQGLESGISNPYISFAVGILKRSIVLPLFIWGINNVRIEFKDRYVGYLNLLVFGNIIYFLFALSIPVIQRLAVPFLFFEILLWGFFITSIKSFNVRVLAYVLLVLFAAFRLYAFIIPYKDEYFPFQTIL